MPVPVEDEPFAGRCPVQFEASQASGQFEGAGPNGLLRPGQEPGLIQNRAEKEHGGGVGPDRIGDPGVLKNSEENESQPQR